MHRLLVGASIMGCVGDTAAQTGISVALCLGHCATQYRS